MAIFVLHIKKKRSPLIIFVFIKEFLFDKLKKKNIFIKKTSLSDFWKLTYNTFGNEHLLFKTFSNARN